MSEVVRTWRSCAEVNGISLDTLGRWRRKHGDRTTTPWWSSPDACRAWLAALIAPPPVAEPPAPRQRRSRPTGQALDVGALRRELTR